MKLLILLLIALAASPAWGRTWSFRVWLDEREIGTHRFTLAESGEAYAVDWRSGGECVMSFAYWNPKILGERALLNAQTGELEPVRAEPLGDGRWRLVGRKLAIDLWYAGGAEWVALETTTRGGRRLRYRLESAQ
jgi:hypothetical protein